MIEGSLPELAAVIADLRGERPTIPPLVFERAVRRGELPPGTDGNVSSEMLVGLVLAGVLWTVEAVENERLARWIDVVVSGAAQGAAVPRVPTATNDR